MIHLKATRNYCPHCKVYTHVIYFCKNQTENPNYKKEYYNKFPYEAKIFPIINSSKNFPKFLKI